MSSFHYADGKDFETVAASKVYCRACRFFREAVTTGPYRHDQQCRHPSAREDVDTPLQQVVRWCRPSERNACNDCPDFESRRGPASGSAAELVLNCLVVLGFMVFVYLMVR